MPKQPRPFVPLNVAVLTVSDTRTLADDASGDLIQEELISAGHRVAKREIKGAEIALLRALFQEWIADRTVDAIIVSGGTGITPRDVTPEALAPLVTKPIPGFGELFRMLSFQEIGTAAITSRAEAAVAQETLVFLLPGSTGACRLGMQQIILPQLDPTRTKCNVAELLPRAQP